MPVLVSGIMTGKLSAAAVSAPILLFAGPVADRDEEFPQGVGPGFIGFVVIFLLGAACYLLFHSMSRHLRKVRYVPDPAEVKQGDVLLSGSAQDDVLLNESAGAAKPPEQSTPSS